MARRRKQIGLLGMALGLAVGVPLHFAKERMGNGPRYRGGSRRRRRKRYWWE